MEQPAVTLPSGQQQQLQATTINIGHQKLGSQELQKPGFVPQTTVPAASQHNNRMVQAFSPYSLPS